MGNVSANRKKHSKSPARQAPLRKVSHVGPGWKLSDWRKFQRLCIDGLLLEPDTAPIGGLMGYRSPSRFPGVAQAIAALHADPVYIWLAKNVPLASQTTKDPTVYVQFRRVRAVSEYIAFGSGPPLKEIRADRQRKCAANSAERVLRSLYSGTLRFPNPARQEFFEELLEEAVRILRCTKRQLRAHKYPWLRLLARTLVEQTGACDYKLLLQVAAVIAPECEERTAQNYAEEARNAREK